MAEDQKLTSDELDRLFALSRRRPMGEAMIAWSSVWGLLVMGFSLVLPNFFFRGDVLLLERILIVLIGAGALAAALCWFHIKRIDPKVERARETLRALAKNAKREGCFNE